MFATRQSTMRRRKKKKGVRRGAAAAATLLCWSPVATIATRQHCGANDCLEGNFRTMRVHTQTQGRHWKQHTNTYSNIPNASSRFFVLCVLFFFPFEMGKKKAGNGWNVINFSWNGRNTINCVSLCDNYENESFWGACDLPFSCVYWTHGRTGTLGSLFCTDWIPISDWETIGPSMSIFQQQIFFFFTFLALLSFWTLSRGVLPACVCIFFTRYCCVGLPPFFSLVPYFFLFYLLLSILLFSMDRSYSVRMGNEK